MLVVSFDDTNPHWTATTSGTTGTCSSSGASTPVRAVRRRSSSSMNDARQIVGSVINSDGVERAFLWQNGQMTDLAGPRDDWFSASTRSRTADDRQRVHAFDDQNGHGARLQGVVGRARARAHDRSAVGRQLRPRAALGERDGNDRRLLRFSVQRDRVVRRSGHRPERARAGRQPRSSSTRDAT